ncbi:helix-turn-helix domain-containing protein [Streptomyces sp. CBMA123]|uniref:helix-turn-helix domain-containing protein n=1 Tax=Streptomyces sp. CBMA123 TaxID=1896313 RepID=UPI001661F981|nr:helix-turn-helix domain-containing protein [Streptomyces sp. CBMA123]MBD0689528.1 hypothetical protein [Streptomyces sp. CBMA123]
MYRISNGARREGAGADAAGADGLRRVADGARARSRSCLAPDRPEIRRLLEADIADRAHAPRALDGGPCSTTELARTLAITPRSASAHAVALRAVRLIATRCEGKQVRHALSEVGHDLLLGNPAVARAG